MTKHTMPMVVLLLMAVACKSGPTSVSGVVTDSTGAVLSGVSVTAGTAKAITALDGTFSLAASVQESLVVGFSKTGYLPSAKVVTVTDGTTANVAAALMALAAPVPLDATQGGTVSGTRGASLKAAPGVLVDGSGKPVSGSVDVSLTPLSPAVPGERAAYPGSLIGSRNDGSTPSLLHTYGVLDVTIMQNGQPIQVAPGQTVTVTIPVAAAGTLLQTQDLWSFNLATGMWDHEGTAQLAGSAYTAQIAHFSYHNIDAQVLSGQATCISGQVVNTAGQPVAGAYVSPTEGASLDTLIVTDAEGRYCTWLLTGATETITADATAPPYGEGTVTVTGGSSAIPFPGTESCTGLPCTMAPPIVLKQPPCQTTADCPADDTCCAVSGNNMCLEPIACQEATTGGSKGPGSTKPSCTTGGGSFTATFSGQTITFTCFSAQLIIDNLGNGLPIYGVLNFYGEAETTTRLTWFTFQYQAPLASLTTGASLPIGSGNGNQTAGELVVEQFQFSGLPEAPVGYSGLNAMSGSVTLNTLSMSSGGQVSITIPAGTQLSGTMMSGTADGGSTPVNGTLSGSATTTLTVSQ